VSSDQALAALDRAIASAAPAERPALVVGLASRLAVLGAGLAPQPGLAAEDRNLDIGEAAQRLGMSKAWLYRHGGEMPFAVRLGRRLLFSEAGLAAFLERRRRT
jgi:predicted DNA-binding transcriptional regulator AlpA